jgi:hypothetical protein
MHGRTYGEGIAMPLSHLEHALIRPPTGHKNWYVDVLGMKVGPHRISRCGLLALYRAMMSCMPKWQNVPKRG